uniref:Neuroproteinsis n=1 Tax=Loa loa TaxID=7209 RepID=A0A1I7V5Q4_LOALO
METYEGPVDSIYRIQDVESEPIEHLVTVYHSGRSDEFVPMEEKKPSVDAHMMGRLASTSLAWDVEGEPLQQHVSVYHSGRSDEPMTKIVEIPTEISLEEVPVVEKPTVTAKIITGLFKKDETYLDYPAMETYEGPVDSIYRIQDVESEPIEHLLFVNIYHSGRSDLMPGELPFHFFAREDKISDTKVESRLYPPFKDTDFHDRMFQFDNVKPLVPPCTAAYAGNEYKICRPLEPPTSPSKPEHRANDFDISISGRIASGRTLPVGIAHPVPKISEIPKSRHYDEIAEVRRSEVTSTPHDFDYHRKTREVDYWIGRRSERQSKPYRDLTADIGIDLASDVGWEERNIFETQPLETTGIRQSARDYSTYPSKVRARKVSPTAHLHWTTVSEKTSISYKKRISIERRRPHQTSSPQLATYRRQYRPPPPPPEVSAYARHDRAVFESSTLPRTYAGVAIEGDLRMQRARYEASSLPSSYYSSTETRIERNPVRYDLPRPSTPPRYEYWAGERNKWTVEGSPKQFSITDQNGHSAYDDYYMKRTKQEALHYQKSNLEEIPIISLIKDLPMIEDGADECSCASILPASRIETQDLPPGEHSRPSRSAPLRRARQRIRNLCTML